MVDRLLSILIRNAKMSHRMRRVGAPRDDIELRSCCCHHDLTINYSPATPPPKHRTADVSQELTAADGCQLMDDHLVRSSR